VTQLQLLEVKYLVSEWWWSQSEMQDLDKILQILVFLRKNDGYFSLKGVCEKKYIFVKELTFLTAHEGSSKSQVLIHVVSLSQRGDSASRLLHVQIFAENDFQLYCQAVGEAPLQLIELLLQHCERLRRQEEAIIKQLYTVHFVHMEALINMLRQEQLYSSEEIPSLIRLLSQEEY